MNDYAFEGSNEDSVDIIYLLHLKSGFCDYYFRFRSISAINTFVSMIKCTFVESISDQILQTQIEVLTKKEYEERINKEDE